MTYDDNLVRRSGFRSRPPEIDEPYGLMMLSSCQVDDSGFTETWTHTVVAPSGIARETVFYQKLSVSREALASALPSERREIRGGDAWTIFKRLRGFAQTVKAEARRPLLDAARQAVAQAVAHTSCQVTDEDDTRVAIAFKSGAESVLAAIDAADKEGV